MPARVGAEAQQMRDLWGRAVEEIKRSVNSVTAYRALEKTVPIAWEDHNFAIGFAGSDGQMGAQLNTNEYRLIIERILQNLTGDTALRFRIIDGTGYDDWEALQKTEAIAQASRQQVAEKRSVEAKTFTSWDEVYDQVSRLWSTSEYRALSTGRARYFDAAFAVVLKAMATIYPPGVKVDEPTERGLARIVERIASMSSTDPTLVAYLLFDRRKREQTPS